MNGLQPGPDIGKCARHDHAHRVIEVRALHLVFDRDGGDVGGGRGGGGDGQGYSVRKKIAAAPWGATARSIWSFPCNITALRGCEQTISPPQRLPRPVL